MSAHSMSQSSIQSPATSEMGFAVEKQTIVVNAPPNDEESLSRSVVDNQQRTVTGISWAIVVVSVLSSTFLYAFDNTVMANVRPSIIDTFGQIDLLPWISVSYPLGEVGSNPLWGKLNAHFNSKKLYITAVVIFEIGSAVSGAAQSMSMLIVGRVLSGFGGSGIYVGTVNIISAMTMASERAQYLNFVGMAWSLGTILGPIIGGAFADSSATWRWAFYINICIAGLALPACVFLIPSMTSNQSQSVWRRVKTIDYLGVVLFFGGVLTIIMVLSFGGSVYGWDSGQMIGLYVATVVVWLVFGLQQGFTVFTFDRIFPAEFVGDWEMVNLFSWTAIAISNLVITVYTLPLLFQFARGYTALRASVFMLPYIGAGVAAAGAGGPLFARFPIYKFWFAGAAVFMLIGNALMTTVTVNTPTGVICAYTVIQGLGFGPVVQLGFTVAQVKKSKDQQRKVTAFLTCAQMGGLALSLGISTCIFLNQTTDQLGVILPNVPKDAVQAAINGARNGIFQTLQPEVLARVLAVIARNAARLFYLNVAGAAMGIVTALLMPRERLVLENSV